MKNLDNTQPSSPKIDVKNAIGATETNGNEISFFPSDSLV